jgi:hypothetical protein
MTWPRVHLTSFLHNLQTYIFICNLAPTTKAQCAQEIGGRKTVKQFAADKLPSLEALVTHAQLTTEMVGMSRLVSYMMYN